MSCLIFDIKRAQLSKLILCLANPRVLGVNVKSGSTTAEVAEAVLAIAHEIDSREQRWLEFERIATGQRATQHGVAS